MFKQSNPNQKQIQSTQDQMILITNELIILFTGNPTNLRDSINFIDTSRSLFKT